MYRLLIIKIVIWMVFVLGCHAANEASELFRDEKLILYEGKYLFPPSMHNDYQPAEKANKYCEKLNDFGIDKLSEGAVIFFNNSRFLCKRVVNEQKHVFLECHLTNTIRVYLGYQAYTSSDGVVPFTYLDITEKFIQKHQEEYYTYYSKIPKIDLRWRESVDFFKNGYEITVSESDFNKVVSAVGHIVYGLDWRNSGLRIDIGQIRKNEGYAGWKYQSMYPDKYYKTKESNGWKIYYSRNRDIIVDDAGEVLGGRFQGISFFWIVY